MDTAHTAYHSISVADLFGRLGSPRWPVVLDVRRAPAYEKDPETLPAAVRCPPEEVEAFAASLAAGTEAVCVCVHGHEVSQGAASALRARNVAARYLEGGIEAWRAAGAAALRKHAQLGVPGPRPSRWMTRERPKIDRIACPWLVRRFVDPRAEFVYLPVAEVLDAARREHAIAFDIPGGAIAHDGELCSFDVLLREFGLRNPALDVLARIVRGADTNRPELTPQSPGLLAVSQGLSRLCPDDHEMLAHGMVVYDALYAWCRAETAR